MLRASNPSIHVNKHEQQPPLPDLTGNPIGDVTCADAQWCPVGAILRRIGKVFVDCLLGAWHLLASTCVYSRCAN